MFIPTFFTIATAIFSIFTLSNAQPTKANPAITEPRSLLGRQYRDVRVRHSFTADKLPLRRFDVVVESAEHITRSGRFHAIQRKRAEQLPDHGENLLSNQSLGPPPTVQNPIPIPLSSSTQPNPNPPVTSLVSAPRRRVRHDVKRLKDQKTGKKAVKA